jgi:hypothetical protein
LLAGALLLVSRTAWSQGSQIRAPTEVEPIAVELESGCVTAGEFVERVTSRTARARAAAQDEPARRIRVTIEGQERVVGRLFVTGIDGTIIAREVEGATCLEVIDALALVLAVALDPLLDPKPATGASPSLASSGPTPALAPRRHRSAERARRVPARPVREVRWRHVVGAETTVFIGLFDQPMAGLGARYATSRESRSETSFLLTLGAFATFAADAEANHPAPGLIRYRLQALEAGVCPVGVLVQQRARLYPCTSLTVGRLQAEGVNLPGSRSDVAPFVAAALTGRATFEVIGPLGLLAAAGLAVPLGRYSAVVVGAGESVGEVYPLGIILGLGVAARLP